VKGSGVWWAFVNHKGERASMMIGSEKAALEVQQTVEAQLKLGQYSFSKPEAPSNQPTLEAYYRKFERTYLKTACRESTAERYDECFRIYILPALGMIHLGEITREKVQDLVATLVEKKLARPTIRIITANLCTVINHAVEDRLLTYNPAARLTRFFKQAKVAHEKIEPLTFEEVPKFLEAAAALDGKKRYRDVPDYYPLFLCAVHTGLRSGELAGLQWGDIDWNGKFIMVRRSIKRGRVYPTKTDKVRRVDMSDAVLAELADLRRRHKEGYLAKGKNEIHVILTTT
jgi:integrase